MALAAATVALYSLGLLAEGFVGERYSGLLTYPLIDKTAAERYYDRLPAQTPAPARRAAALRVVSADPANPEAWLAIAFADWQADHGMSPAAAAALDRSYAVSFFARRAAPWRVSFALQNWDSLSPQTRLAVLAEASVALHDANLSPQMRSALQSVSNPAGRLAVLLLLKRPKA